MFLTNDITNRHHDCLDYEQITDIERKMELLDSITFSDQIQSSHQGRILEQLSTSHAIDNYYEVLTTWRTTPGVFPDIQEVDGQAGDLGFEPIKMREVSLKKNWYLPNIHFAELIKIASEDSPRLRLRLIGQNLTHVVLRKSLFSFGFPFATNPDKVRELLT